MKFKIVILIFTALMLSHCDKDNGDTIEGVWNVKSITGGFAGVNCIYQDGDMVWTFDENTLSIQNNLTEMTICNSLFTTSSFTYSVLNSNGDTFLEMDEAEVGEIIFSGDEMTIDQNSYSNGTGADGFLIMLEKV